MSQMGDFISSGLEELETLVNEFFTWKNTAVIPCVPSTLERGQVIVSGGSEVTVRLTLNVRLSQFVSADSTIITADSELYTADSDRPRPVAGQTLLYYGRSYRIASAKIAAGLSHVSLVLIDANSGR